MFLMLGLLFALLVAIFAVQNAQEVPITILVWTVAAPLSLVILGTAAAGAVLAGLIGLVKQVGMGFRLRNVRAEKTRAEEERKRLEGQVRLLEAEVRALRARKEELEGKISPPADEPGSPGP